MTVGRWLIGAALMVMIGLGVSYATAHDTGYIAHDIAHRFNSHYDEVREVYCGWRHGFEGISCVKVGD